MDIQKYIITLLIVQSVRSNFITGKWELEIPENTRTDVERQKYIGVKPSGNNNEVYALTMHKGITSADKGMTSSDLLHFLVTSQSSSDNSAVRTRRSSSRKSERKSKKLRCKPGDIVCKRKRKQERKKKKKRKCKKRGKRGRKRCKKIKNPPINQPTKATTTTTTTTTTTAASTLHQKNNNTNATDDAKIHCVRSSECPAGYCCARHHYLRVCRPLLKEDDVCTRRQKYRRNSEYFERCPCEKTLACRKEIQVDKDGKKIRNSSPRPSLYKCVANT